MLLKKEKTGVYFLYMKLENQEKRFGNPEKLAMGDEERGTSFKEQVTKLRTFARDRLGKEDTLAKFISSWSKGIPDEEECERLANTTEWKFQRVVEGPMVRALIEEYTERKRG